MDRTKQLQDLREEAEIELADKMLEVEELETEIKGYSNQIFNIHEEEL